MPKFSEGSQAKLATCHKDLQTVFNLVVIDFDCTILAGERDEATQAELLRTNKTQVSYPNSKHNSSPSMAVDVAPYPINWQDREQFTLFAGYVLGIALGVGVKLRWGGDWDCDFKVADNNFDDLPHFELIEE